MLEENYKEKRVLNSMMKNSAIERSLRSEKKQNVVLDIMVEQKITTDPNKLDGYKKEAFLKAVNKKIGFGYYQKKAMNEVYGAKKPEPAKPLVNKKEEFAARRKKYDEIMAKRNPVSRETIKAPISNHTESHVLNLSVSQKRLRDAQQANLLGGTNSGNKELIKDRLKLLGS